MNYYAINKSKIGKKKYYTIFFRITLENNETKLFNISAEVKGNKRISLGFLLRKYNKIDYFDPTCNKGILVPVKNWKNIGELEFVRHLKRGNLSDLARRELFAIFGKKYFGLTQFEYRYFSTNFSNIERLISFYRTVQKEKHYHITREFNGEMIVITSTKIKKAARELFGVELDEAILNNKKHGN